MQSTVKFLYLLLLSLQAFGFVQLKKCEPITIPQCKTMPYNMTRLPNVFQHEEQEQGKQFLAEFDILLKTKCSKELMFYLCAKIVPICWEGPGLPPEPVKPCKSVCQKVKEDCLPAIRNLNKTWPNDTQHDCEALPEYENGVCIHPKSFINAVAPQEVMCERNCNCCSRMDFRKYKENKLNRYAYRARLKRITDNSDGSKDFTIKILRKVLDLGHTSARLSQETIRSHCDGVNLVKGRVYLFAGHVDTANNQMVLECVQLWTPVLRRKMRNINNKIKGP